MAYDLMAPVSDYSRWLGTRQLGVRPDVGGDGQIMVPFEEYFKRYIDDALNALGNVVDPMIQNVEYPKWLQALYPEYQTQGDAWWDQGWDPYPGVDPTTGHSWGQTGFGDIWNRAPGSAEATAYLDSMKQAQTPFRVNEQGLWDPAGAYALLPKHKESFLEKIGALPFLIPLAGMALPAMLGTAGAGAAASGAAGAAGAGIPELGLIANNATLGGAIAGGIPAAELAAMGAGTLGASGAAGGGMFDWWDAVMPEWSAGTGNFAPVVDLSTQLGLTGGTPFAGPMFPSLANLGASLTGSGAFGNLLGGLTSLPTSLLQGLTGGSGGAGGFGGLGGFGGGGGDFSLLGAILGGLAGSQNEPNQVGTQTVVQDVPDWMKGYYQDLFGKTQTQLGNTAPYDFSNARNFLDQTISGNNMVTPQKNPFYGLDNPYLNDVIGQTKAGVSNDILQRFGSGTNPNAFGTTAQQQTFAKELSDAENRLRYQDYGLQAQLGEQDVNRNLQADMFNMGNRMNAAQGMPNFANSMYQAQFAPYSQAGNIYKLNQASQTSQPIYGPSSGYGALSGALTGGSLLGRLF